VIDDEAASQAALMRLLTQSGHDVRTVTDGSEGLRRLAEGSPDAPLRCPYGRGSTVTRTVRSSPHWFFSVTCTAFVLVLFANPSCAQTQQALPPASTLKQLSVAELLNIEVTSVSKRPEKLADTASAIQVITQEDIRRSGATRLPEALRLASNLEVDQIDSSQWAISARGFNSNLANKLLVLIDGRAVYSPLFAGVFWDVQDTLLADVERIEVISGPGATLWGANAVNGVINITTKNAKDTQGVLMEGGGGTELRGFGGVRYGGALASNLYFRVYGKYFDRDSTVFSNGQDANNEWRMGQGGFRLDWDASSANHLTLQGDLYDSRTELAGAKDAVTRGGNVLGRWSYTCPKIPISSCNCTSTAVIGTFPMLITISSTPTTSISSTACPWGRGMRSCGVQVTDWSKIILGPGA
jgi:CheY-like chemotaxis protein